jgi:hypothetical protein
MRGYNWRSNWVIRYESLWSIIEKFKYANSISSKEFYHLFQVYNQSMGDENVNTSLGNNVTLIEFLSSLLDYPLREHQDETKIKLISESDKFNLILNEKLKYCPVCIQDRHHSVLHQFKYFSFCPFHINKPLIQFCLSCCNSIPFKLINENLESFDCSCIETVYGFKREFLLDVKYHQSIQIARIQNDWFLKNDIVKNRVYFSTHQKDVSVETLNRFDFNIKNRNKILNQETQDFKNEYNCYKAIYSSIARNYRKRMNKQQLKALSLTKKNLTFSEDPLVQTYLFWRAKLEGRESINSIDNGKPRGKDLTQFDRYYSPLLYENLSVLNRFIEKHSKVSNDSKRYILSKCFELNLTNLYEKIYYKVVNNQRYSTFETIKNPFYIGDVELQKESQVITLYYQKIS